MPVCIRILVLAALAIAPCAARSEETLLVEAEGFRDRGGWVVDQQSMDQMGSPYLLAHGLGVPVADATTAVRLAAGGQYRVFVRTRDWVANWGAQGSPGKFHLLVNGKPLDAVFGTEGAEWHWQDGGTVKLEPGEVSLALRDLTGFAGRCDAILLTSRGDFAPPNRDPEMAAMRRELLQLPDQAPSAGRFDLVVVGGGMAGTCTAISAARLGVKVALIQDRPLLGGNNSSEVRVGLSGRIHKDPYPRLGDLVDEIGPVGHWNRQDAIDNPDLPRSREVLAIIEKHPEKKVHNAGPESNYEDQRKLDAVRAEPNLALFLNTHVFRAEMRGNRIAAVVGKDILTSRELKFAAPLFADCTGDGSVGFLAGADCRMGRESRAETGESRAPDEADMMIMGTSVQWYAVREAEPAPFPDCPWAVQFNDETYQRTSRGDWDWEVGMNMNQITEFEAVRDHAFRVIFGNWAYQKNHSPIREKLANERLAWVAYIGGKRESRRLGDVILQEQDILQAQAVSGRLRDDNLGHRLCTIRIREHEAFPGRGVPLGSANDGDLPLPDPVPLPLFSRNVENLMMAGWNISVTHVALGTVRVQRTTGMMGEVLGMAASLCNGNALTPRGVYRHHFDELREPMRRAPARRAPPRKRTVSRVGLPWRLCHR